jgi:phosphatidylcholine synthase
MQKKGFVAKLNLHHNVDRDLKKGIAWAVHAFTTCGIVLGFLALVAVLKNDPVAAFMWLGLALFVDGIDGSLARKARVLEYTPNVDGRTLDNVIDFFNYVAVPALMVYWFDMVPDAWALNVIAAATIMAVSCYTFANVGMKSDDYYFVGFPALWNIVVLYFYILDTHWVINVFTIAALAVLTFIPVKFVHPLRVTDWREITIPMTVLWAAMSLSLILSAREHASWGRVEWIELAAWVLASLYFIGISLWRSFFKKPEVDDDQAAPAA